MDRHCKRLLKALRSYPAYTFIRSGDIPVPEGLTVSEDEFNLITRYLSGRGYLIDTNYSITLTYQGLHYNRFALKRFWEYIRDNWISFLALIISILALAF